MWATLPLTTTSIGDGKHSTYKNCDDLGMVYEIGFTTVHVYSQTVSMDITESHMATTPSYGPRLTAPHLRQEV